nr:MAG TPA: hypothetical protein [Caudoviricetes sp.]
MPWLAPLPSQVLRLCLGDTADLALSLGIFGFLGTTIQSVQNSLLLFCGCVGLIDESDDRHNVNGVGFVICNLLLKVGNLLVLGFGFGLGFSFLLGVLFGLLCVGFLSLGGLVSLSLVQSSPCGLNIGLIDTLKRFTLDKAGTCENQLGQKCFVYLGKVTVYCGACICGDLAQNYKVSVGDTIQGAALGLLELGGVTRTQHHKPCPCGLAHIVRSDFEHLQVLFRSALGFTQGSKDGHRFIQGGGSLENAVFGFGNTVLGQRLSGDCSGFGIGVDDIQKQVGNGVELDVFLKFHSFLPLVYDCLCAGNHQHLTRHKHCVCTLSSVRYTLRIANTENFCVYACEQVVSSLVSQAMVKVYSPDFVSPCDCTSTAKGYS